MNNEYDQAYEDYGRMIDNLLAASDGRINIGQWFCENIPMM